MTLAATAGVCLLAGYLYGAHRLRRALQTTDGRRRHSHHVALRVLEPATVPLREVAPVTQPLPTTPVRVTRLRVVS